MQLLSLVLSSPLKMAREITPKAQKSFLPVEPVPRIQPKLGKVQCCWVVAGGTTACWGRRGAALQVTARSQTAAFCLSRPKFQPEFPVQMDGDKNLAALSTHQCQHCCIKGKFPSRDPTAVPLGTDSCFSQFSLLSEIQTLQKIFSLKILKIF